MVRREPPAAPGGAPPHLTWRPHPPTRPGRGGTQGPRPRPRAAPTLAPQTRSLRRQGGRAGSRLSPSALARLDSAPPPPLPWRRRSSRGVSARVCARGRFTFSLPPPPRARRLPHPAQAGESPQDGAGVSDGERAGGRRRGSRGCCEGRERRGLGQPLGNEVGRQSSLKARGSVKEGVRV